MCGIGGVMVYQKNRTSDELAFIKELITNIAIENQARGNQATGIAVIGKNGHDVMKHNISAEEFTSLDTYRNFLDKNINQDTYNVLIHTRLATQGSPTNNNNNHPIVSASAIGVHNGWINNDDKLFKKENMFRLAEVDSEVIFRLADKELGNERENVKNMAEKLAGAYAVAFVKKNEPHKLNWFRNNNPTTFAYIPDLNITVFASVEKFIKDAIAVANASLFYERGYSVSEENIVYFSPKYDTIMQFDVTENTPLQQLEQEPLKFTESYDYSSHYGGKYFDSWYDDDYYYDDWKESRKEGNSKKEITSIYEFIEEKSLAYMMTDDEYTQMIELLDQLEKNEWSRGYKAGRSSLDNEIKILREQSKEKLAN